MDTVNEFNIVFNIDSPQEKNTEIEISIDTYAEGEFLYKFLIGFDGKWNTISNFTENKNVKWIPLEEGIHTIMAQIRKKHSTKSFDYVSKEEYTIEKKLKKAEKDMPLGPVFIDEVIMEKNRCFIKNETIHIKVMASGSHDIRYSFIVRKDGNELEEIKYGSCSWVNFTPEMAGEFELEIRIKDKYSESEFDSREFILINVFDFLHAKIDYVIIPPRQYYIVSDIVTLETIVQNTNNVLVKYILKINNHIIEQTDYVEGKKYKFTPKCSGMYSVEILVKNIHSDLPYDSKKEMRVRIYDSYPITNAKILCDKDIFKANESLTFSVAYEGGEDVMCEFYIMEGGEWKPIQNYSKKNYYMFIPFNKGVYKILALLKSQKNKFSYEDYDIFTFNIE